MRNQTGLSAFSAPEWGEQWLNAAISHSLQPLFKHSESIEVSVNCSPATKLLLGNINNCQIRCRNLVIAENFQLEEILLETNTVNIDFRSLLGGQLQLKQPTQVVATVTLSEASTNRAFESSLLRKHLENISVPALGELCGNQPISFTQVAVKLLAGNRLKLSAQADLPNYGQVPISLSAMIIEQRQRLRFENLHFELEQVPVSSRAVAHDLAATFTQLLDQMIDLKRFELNGVDLHLNRLETQGKKLLLHGCAIVKQFPDAFNLSEMNPSGKIEQAIDAQHRITAQELIQK